MAETVERIIEIKTQGAATSVKELKEQIRELRDSLVAADKSSEAYSAIVKELINAETKLKEVMSAGKSSVEAVAGSYDDLRNKMSALKKVWQGLEIGSDEWIKVGNQVNALNDKLKDADAKIGFFQRNVGDYKNQLLGAFGSVASSAQNVINPLNSMGISMKALSANPLLAAFSALVVVLRKIAEGFKSSNANMDSLNKSMAALKPVMDGVSAVFQEVAGWIAKTIEGIVSALQWLGVLGKESEEQMKRAQRENELEDERRRVEEENARISIEAAQAREKAQDQENYSIQQRIEFTKEASEKEKQIAENNAALAKEQLAIIEMATDAERQSTEWIEKHNQAVIAAANATAQVSKVTEQGLRQTNRLLKEGANAAKQAKKDYEDALKSLMQLTVEVTEDGGQEAYDAEKKLLDLQFRQQMEYYRRSRLSKQEQNQAMLYLEEKYQKDILALNKKYSLETSLKQIRESTERQKSGVLSGGYLDLKIDEKATIETINEIENKINESYKELTQSFDEWISNPNNPVEALGNAEEVFEQYKETIRKYINNELMPEYEEATNKLIDININLTKQFYDAQDTISTAALDILKDNSLAYAKSANEIARQQFGRLFDDIKSILDPNNKNRVAVAQFINEVEGSLVNPEQFDAVKKEYAYLEKALGDSIENIVAKYRMLQQNVATSNQALEDTIKQVNKLTLIRESGYDFEANSGGWGLMQTLQKQLIEAEYDFNNAKQKIGESDVEFYNRRLEAYQRYVDAEKALNMQRMQNYQDLATGIGDIMGSIGDIWEESINQRVKEGKISEQQAKEEFENVKALQIAQATINTISGGITAYMKAMELGYPMGPIIGAAQATATVLAGVAQIQKIANTQFGSSNSSNISSINAASSTPTVMKNIDIEGQTTNLNEMKQLRNSFKDANLFVSVTDIDRKQKQVRVVNRETTW